MVGAATWKAQEPITVDTEGWCIEADTWKAHESQ